MNAIWRPWVIFSATVLLLSVIAGLCLGDLMTPDQGEIYHYGPMTTLIVLVYIITVLAIGAYLAVSFYFVIYRYYQNFFTDEGYLTFTLPVKRSTLFNSKILNALIWNTASTLVLIASISITLGLAPEYSDGTGNMLVAVIEGALEEISFFFDMTGGWAVAFITAFILIVLAMIAFYTLLLYCAVTVGVIIAKKAKVLMAILVFYIASTVMSFFGFILTAVGDLATRAFTILDGRYGYEVGNIITLFVMLGIAMAIVILSVTVYSFTLSRIEKNLNLN